jgi:hypothetical protein
VLCFRGLGFDVVEDISLFLALFLACCVVERLVEGGFEHLSGALLCMVELDLVSSGMIFCELYRL